MQWQVGQTVKWDVAEQPLEGIIVCNEFGNIIISCTKPAILITGGQQDLCQLGWRSIDDVPLMELPNPVDKDARCLAAQWN
jgi:hypothetical protein